jgi:hypothetical protein
MPDKWEKFAEPAVDGASVDKWAQYAEPASTSAENPTATTLSKTTGISARTPPPSQGPVIDAVSHAEDWVRGKATSGSNAKAGEFMASVPLGVLRATKGALEMNTPGQSTWRGVKDITSGVGEAATMPSLVMGLPAAMEAIPSAARAGQKFEDVLAAARNVPIDQTGPLAAAERGRQIASRGGRLPKVMNDFIRRANSPTAAPITYEEARDFYTNSRLAMSEYLQTKPNMWRQVTVFKTALDEAVEAAAQTVQKGKMYRDAMTEYRRAKTMQKLAVAGAALGIKIAGWGAAFSAAKSLLPPPKP